MKNLVFICLLAVNLTACNKSSGGNGSVESDGRCTATLVKDFKEFITNQSGSLEDQVNACDKFLGKHGSNMNTCVLGVNGERSELNMQKVKTRCADQKQTYANQTSKREATPVPSQTERESAPKEKPMCSEKLIRDLNGLADAFERKDRTAAVSGCQSFLVDHGQKICVVQFPDGKQTDLDTVKVVTACRTILEKN